VPAVRSLRPGPQFAERQVDVVANDQQILQRQLVEVDQLTDAAATEVHVGLGLDQQNLRAVLDQFGDLGLETTLKAACVRTLGEQIDDGKADVVPGAVILSARIAQSHDDLESVHRSDYFFSSASSSPFGRPMTSGSACAAAGAASGSASGAMICTTIAS